MKLWHKILIAFMLCVSAVVVWENLPGGYRILAVLALFFWVLGGLVLCVVQILCSERAYRPYFWGNRFQRKMFLRTMVYGPFAFLIMSPVIKGEPLIK